MSPARPLTPPADGPAAACQRKRHYATFGLALHKLGELRREWPEYWSPQLAIYRCPVCGRWALGRESHPAVW